ncbi:MAG: hypothetical protein LBL50_05215 [Candidatus Margulisbacteria bacterium]|jgi:hypothetical protein|nr:hypothetical protein [Candidatus Margulisiibacteriota bacterium]
MAAALDLAGQIAVRLVMVVVAQIATLVAVVLAMVVVVQVAALVAVTFATAVVVQTVPKNVAAIVQQVAHKLVWLRVI